MELRIFPLLAITARIFRASSAIAITGALGLLASAQAADYTWGGGSLNWTDTSATGWNGGPPDTSDTATINSGRVEVFNGAITGTAPISIGAGGQLWLNTNSLNIANHITLHGTTTGGAIVSGDGPENNIRTLSGQITLASTSNIASWWNDKTLEISGKITGAGGLILDRATSIVGGDPVGGKFLISGTTNDFSGGTTVNGRAAGDLYGYPGQSQLFLGANNALPSGSTLTLNTAHLYLNGFSQTLSDINGTGTNSVRNGNATAGSLTMNVATTRAFGGIMGGTGTDQNHFSLTKDGSGTLTLTGANTYTGATTISAGTLQLQGAAFSTTARAYTIVSGAVLNLDGGTGVASGTTTLSGAGTLRISGGALSNGTGPGLNVNMELGSGAVIEIQSGASMQNGGWQNMTWTTNKADMQVDGTFDIWDGNPVKIDALTGSGTVDKNHPNTPTSLTVGVDNGSGIFSGTIANTRSQLSLVKTGSGTQTLSNTNSYSGNTTLQAGTLRLGNGTSPTNLADTADVIVSPGGMLDLDYTGTDIIRALWVDGRRMPPGVYSSTSGFITGTGTLTVTTGPASASANYATWSGRGMYDLIGGPSDDDDQDGITNHAEYAFGLIPNSGASCNPISAGLNKSSGTFSYTRRKPSPGTNLAYSVWFSENLVDWTEDTAATEGTPVLSGEIETVEVTLSDLPGSPLPDKLFIRVRANALPESPFANAETRMVMLQFQSAAGAEVLSLPDTGELQAGGGRWSCQTQTSPVPGRQDCEDITVTVNLLEGEAKAASISYIFEFSDWDPAGYVMVPGAVYNGNRFDVSFQSWPPLWRETSQFRVDMPITTTDQPRLNKDGSPGKIELDTGASSTPAMGLRTVDGGGFLLLTKQQCEFGNLGLTIEEQPAENRLRLVVSAPRSRSRIPNMMGFRAGDSPRDWRAGDTVTLHMRAWKFSAPAIQSLFDRFAECRKDMEPSAPVNEVPFSVAWHLLEDKLNSNNWNENLGFYCHGNTTGGPKPLYDYWQLGWVSGGINTIANLLQGNDLSRSRTQRTLDFMFTKTPAQSGFWYGASDGVGFYGDGIFEPHPHNLSMVRKQADGLAFGMKQLLLMREQNSPVPPAWETSARGLADTFIRHWQEYGQLGQFIDIETGDILVGKSTAGAHVPAGLALAANYFNEPTYLQIAEEIGRYFLNNDLQSGVTCGGPGEAMAAPDSESAFALAESFVELQQATGKPEWANAARDAVRQCASWVVSYDYRFPETSTLGQAGTRATGAVVANAQNKHGAPGICTLSGDSLFKLWRATGDETALDLVRDIAHGIPQYLSRPDRPLGTIAPGWMCERVNLSDWEGGDNVGGNVTFGAVWCENAMILTAAEIPGVYVNTDTRRVIVFDHVTAQLEGDKLVIHNPTQFNADVKVLIENNAAASSPLGIWTLKNANHLAVPAGGNAKISLLADQP